MNSNFDTSGVESQIGNFDEKAEFCIKCTKEGGTKIWSSLKNLVTFPALNYMDKLSNEQKSSVLNQINFKTLGNNWFSNGKHLSLSILVKAICKEVVNCTPVLLYVVIALLILVSLALIAIIVKYFKGKKYQKVSSDYVQNVKIRFGFNYVPTFSGQKRVQESTRRNN